MLDTVFDFNIIIFNSSKNDKPQKWTTLVISQYCTENRIYSLGGLSAREHTGELQRMSCRTVITSSLADFLPAQQTTNITLPSLCFLHKNSTLSLSVIKHGSYSPYYQNTERVAFSRVSSKTAFLSRWFFRWLKAGAGSLSLFSSGSSTWIVLRCRGRAFNNRVIREIQLVIVLVSQRCSRQLINKYLLNNFSEMAANRN